MARILIADDHAMMRKGLRTAIEPHPGGKFAAKPPMGKKRSNRPKH